MPETENYISLSRAALLLDISAMTLKRWYIWYESPRYEVPDGLELPAYVYRDKRGTKFFKMSDVPKLRQFQELVHGPYHGCMAQFNADVAWGKRGQRFERSKLRETRKPGEYAPKSQQTPTDISDKLDKKEEAKWKVEQERERKKRMDSPN